MISVTQLAVGYLCYYLHPIYLLYAFSFVFRMRFYLVLEDRETMNAFLKKLKKDIVSTTTCSIQNREVVAGYFVGKQCFGFIETSYDDVKVSMFCKPAYYTYLKKVDDVKHEATNKESLKTTVVSKIDTFMRKGSFKNFYYVKVKLDLSHVVALGDQSQIIHEIVKVYEAHGRASIFIDGVTNAGKSTIGYLVAKELRGSYCHNFNPTDPGDFLTNLVVESLWDNEGPLVLVLEEADEMIKKIHNNTVGLNHKMPTSVHNKTTWCSFLDDMIFYRKIVLIMTSNTLKQELDALDPSYLRKGRVHAHFCMPTPIEF